MKGKYNHIDKKIVYTSPMYSHLSGGSWKTGWSISQRTGGSTYLYEIVTEIPLEHGVWYDFELIDGKAHIKTK